MSDRRSRAIPERRTPELPRPWRRDFVVIGIASFALNFAAAAFEATLFIPADAKIPAGVRHFGFALLQTILVLLIYGRGWMVFHRPDWFAARSGLGWAFVLTATPLTAAVFEFMAVRTDLWSYSARMPVVPVAEIGIVPVVQMTVFTVAVFLVVSQLQQRG